MATLLLWARGSAKDSVKQLHTRTLAIDAANPDPQVIDHAAQIIRAGGLVAFPTETVYGLGADATNADAVAKIFTAKERPPTNPLIVHIAALDQLTLVAKDVPTAAYDLAWAFWAGALTLVLSRGDVIPLNVSAGRGTVAVRMPSHPVAAALIRASGVPIAAPSANRFTRPSGTTAAHVLEDLAGRVDVILDGGAAIIGVESTIIDLTTDPPLLLRPGGVTLEQVRAVLPALQTRRQYLHADEAAPAPGQMLKHYAPQVPFQVYSGSRAAVLRALADLGGMGGVGLLLTDEDADALAGCGASIERLGSEGAPEQVSANLFAALRRLDSAGVNVIAARLPEGGGLWDAIRDRLTRAAEGRIVNIEG